MYLKQRIKALSAVVYSAELLNALATSVSDRALGHEEEARGRYLRLRAARSALALMMHHDAITGTR